MWVLSGIYKTDRIRAVTKVGCGSREIEACVCGAYPNRTPYSTKIDLSFLIPHTDALLLVMKTSRGKNAFSVAFAFHRWLHLKYLQQARSKGARGYKTRNSTEKESRARSVSDAQVESSLASIAYPFILAASCS